MDQIIIHPDCLFEVSWEICNKVGGIYTAVSTKADSLVSLLGENYIAIGPDIWRGKGPNPDFTEDEALFQTWREHAAAKGLKVKAGRWKINASPIAFMIDFSASYLHKNEIFGDLYKDFGVDSLTGKWDYIEPAMFGYAAGQVIESFYEHYLTGRNAVVAQFHEWLAGAGVLYLNKRVPAIATVFTTHATVVGRALAGTGLPLYDNLEQYNGDARASELNVKAKHSLEKTAAHYADSFTTVSEITARECVQFLEKSPDCITPNGIDESFLPSAEQYASKRERARAKLSAVASAMCGRTIGDDALFIATGGRYEFRNKGLDVLVDALAALDANSKSAKSIVAYFLVPAGETGPREEIQRRLTNPADMHGAEFFTTHYLQDEHNDPIMKRVYEKKLSNGSQSPVTLIFAPVYLEGADGIFDMSYDDLLIGFDLTLFPSYYEPWGYTPMESLSLHIPTITTSLTGFAAWVQKNGVACGNALRIIRRTEYNEDEVTKNLTSEIIAYSRFTSEEMTEAARTAETIARAVLWKNMFWFYEAAWSFALGKLALRADHIREATSLRESEEEIQIEFPNSNLPRWTGIYITPVIPEQFQPLVRLANNLWWTWNPECEELFAAIDPVLWEKYNHNPIALLDSVAVRRLEELVKDAHYLQKLDDATQAFNAYMAAAPESGSPLVAYFCMEFGFHASVRLYSGGLGILAGDFLKEASDARRNVIGVGLLYRAGHFVQRVNLHGEQIADSEDNKFSWMPITPLRDANGGYVLVYLSLPGRTVYAKIWRMDIGRTQLYLLDTDVPDNTPADRKITDQLYGGDNEHRLLQEMVLGICGIRLLDAIGAKPDIYHLNEGHAAFTGLQRIRQLIDTEHLTFQEAVEIVRASSLFTTHTPIPAGQDRFSEELLRSYLSYFPGAVNYSWDLIMALGKEDPRNPHEPFSMSNLAIRLSDEVNAVSELHEHVSRNLFNQLWKGYNADELHIAHVTNGVHFPTWTAPEFMNIYNGVLENNNATAPLPFAEMEQRMKGLYDVPKETIWETKIAVKRRLTEYLRLRIRRGLEGGVEHPQVIFKTIDNINEQAFIIGFARRFIKYKRASMLFADMIKLSSIVNNQKRPVIIIIAGKAHPNDTEGQNILKKTIESLEWSELNTRILFLQNYDMRVARLLVQGSDLWLNTPIRMLEACGTSGMKATLNGTLNFSVPDGWWAEASHDETGWSLPAKQTYKNDADQDELDSELIYSMLEYEIIPAYFDRNAKGVPERWVQRMQNSIVRIGMQFTASRMLEEYFTRHYNGLHARTTALAENKFALAKQLAAWKMDVVEGWDAISIKDFTIPTLTNGEIMYGQPIEARIVLDAGKLTTDDLGVEIVFARLGFDGETHTVYAHEMTARKLRGRDVEYSCSFTPNFAGAYQFGCRLFPKNPLLGNRQNFSLVKWL